MTYPPPPPTIMYKRITWAFSRYDKKMDLLNLKFILTLNHADCVPFSCIISLLFTIEATNFKKFCSLLFPNFRKTYINLTNVFNFRG